MVRGWPIPPPPSPRLYKRDPAALKGYRQVDASAFSAPDRHAPGDRVAVRVLGDSDMLTGTYVVGRDETIA